MGKKAWDVCNWRGKREMFSIQEESVKCSQLPLLLGLRWVNLAGPLPGTVQGKWMMDNISTKRTVGLARCSRWGLPWWSRCLVIECPGVQEAWHGTVCGSNIVFVESIEVINAINVWPSRRDGKAKQKGELVDRAHGGGIIEKSRSFNDSIDWIECVDESEPQLTESIVGCTSRLVHVILAQGPC